jgi:hypothetical protein
VAGAAEVDGEPGEEEPGESGDAELAEVYADEHALAEQPVLAPSSVLGLLVSGLSLERLTLRLDTVCRRQLWKCFAEFRKRREENGLSHCVFEIER